MRNINKTAVETSKIRVTLATLVVEFFFFVNWKKQYGGFMKSVFYFLIDGNNYVVKFWRDIIHEHSIKNVYTTFVTNS